MSSRPLLTRCLRASVHVGHIGADIIAVLLFQAHLKFIFCPSTNENWQYILFLAVHKEKLVAVVLLSVEDKCILFFFYGGNAPENFHVNLRDNFFYRD